MAFGDGLTEGELCSPFFMSGDRPRPTILRLSVSLSSKGVARGPRPVLFQPGHAK